MADLKISALTASTTPLAGTEVLPIVQSSTTKQVSVANLTVGRDTTTGRLTAGTGVDALTGNGTGQVILSGAGQTLNTPGKPTLYHKNGVGLGVYSDYAIDFEVNGGTSKVVAGKFTDTGNLNVLVGNVVMSTSGKGITTGSSIPLGFGVNGSTTQALIDTSGNFLVNAASANAKLSVETGTNSVAGFFKNETSGYQTVTVQNAGASGTRYLEWFIAGTTDVGYITSNGTGVTYATLSDYRLKNITGALTGYKERVMSLQPKQGTWKSDNLEFRGFVAHEFADAYRASVTGEKDAVDENGKPVMQSMQASSSEVMADLVALVQEQQGLIESLKARLDAANL